MQFSAAAVLILSAVTAASAESPPRNINGIQNMFQKVQTTGRRLQGAAMSDACAAACDGAKDVVAAYMANMKAVEGGDYSSLCDHSTALKCMETTDACRDNPEEPVEEGVLCMCACPEMAKMETMKGEDHCTGTTPKASSPYSCAVKNADACPSSSKDILNGWSKGDFDSAMNLHCKRMAKGCEKKGEDVMTCAGDDLTTWMTEGCDEAASKGTLTSKAAKCCPKGTKIMECYDPECIKLSMQSEQLSLKQDHDKATKDRMKEDQAKNFAIGTACPDTGMPASAADLDDPAATASAWALLPSAITLATMAGGLLA